MAQYEISSRFEDGKSIGRDKKQAEHWLRLAAAQEEVRALYRLGNALFHGSPE